MTRLDAATWFSMWPPHGREQFMPGSFTLEGPRGTCDAWPMFAAALVSLTGWLPQLTPQELGEALTHGLSLWDAGVFSDEEVTEEAKLTLADLLYWGETRGKTFRVHARN